MMLYFCYSCKNLKKVSSCDFSKATSVSSAFENCTSLVELPVIDLTSCTNAGSVLRNCQKLVEVTVQNTGKVINSKNFFMNCLCLVTINGKLDLSSIKNATNQDKMFYNCINLETLSFAEGCIHYNISFSESSNLNDKSIQSIIDSLADLTDSTAQKLTLHSTTKARAEELGLIASATAKNWTVA